MVMHKAPLVLKIVNLGRTGQYLTKLIIYWFMFLQTPQSLKVILLGLPFFLLYEIWRIFWLLKRIYTYKLQWALPFCDMAASFLVKSIYANSFKAKSE